MAMQNKRSMIDTRCKELQPGWGPKEHDGELQMLYDALNDDESIESLVGCVWGPENAFRPNANRWDRMMQYDGIAVVTGSRVVLLKKRGINKLTTEMPLHALKSVDVDGEGEVTLTGRSYSEWHGAGNPGAFKMRDVQDGSARNFAGRVGELQAAPPPTGHARLVCSINRGAHRTSSGEPLRRYGEGRAGRCPVAGTLHHVGAE